MEVKTFLWLASFSPILLLVLVLVWFKWGSDEAAWIGLFVSALVGYLAFGGGIDMVALAIAKGMWTALSIILVVFPALAIYEVSKESGAFAVINEGMRSFTPNKVLQVLTVGWLFVGFLQGITGFGVPVAVGAPLLIGLGVKPLTAVLVTLLGQAWGNTFGTLAIAWEGLVSQVDLTNPMIFRSAILWSTGMLGVVNLVAGLLIAWLVGGVIGLKQNTLLVIGLSILQGLIQMWLALQNPMMSNFIATAAALVVITFVGRHSYYQKPFPFYDAVPELECSSEYKSQMNIHQAFIPYYFLIATAMFVLLNNSIKGYLGQWKLALSFLPKITALGFSTKGNDFYSPISPLIHSGAFLLAAAVVGYCCYHSLGCIPPGGLTRIVRKSWDKTVPSAIAVIGLIAMSKIMDETGQTSLLAQGVVSITGPIYPLLSPYLGLLGSFMTSSNLSSNILFGGFQEMAAGMLNADKAPILAAQTVGGAIGSIIAPSKVLLGTTTAGILGKEGDVIRKFIVGAIVVCGAVGATVLAAVRMGW